jgi:hypothetical protein
MVICGWEDGVVRSFDESGRALWTINDCHSGAVSALALANNRRFVLTGGEVSALLRTIEFCYSVRRCFTVVHRLYEVCVSVSMCLPGWGDQALGVAIQRADMSFEGALHTARTRIDSYRGTWWTGAQPDRQ